MAINERLEEIADNLIALGENRDYIEELLINAKRETANVDRWSYADWETLAARSKLVELGKKHGV